jgi:hypothetical protein
MCKTGIRARATLHANGQGRDRSPETASNVLLSVHMKAVLPECAHQHNWLASVCTYRHHRHQHQATRLSLAANYFRMLLSYLDEAHTNLNPRPQTPNLH